MAKKKNKQKQQAKQGRENTQPTPNKSLLRDNEVLKKVFSGLFYFAGSIVAVYELINYFRSDTKTFTSLIIPTLIGIVWLVVLVQMFRRGNSYVYVLLAITVIGGVVGGIGWQSYNRTQEDKVIVLVAQFDGPEETYGIRRQIMEDLQDATKGYDDTVIIEGGELVTSSEAARELGEQEKADLVIWAWYRPTENPNITIHFEKLSSVRISTLRESETYQPQASIADLETFEIQRKLGSETSTLVSFLAGMIRYEAGDYQVAVRHFEEILLKNDISTYIDPGTLHFHIGFSHRMLGQVEESIQDYTNAIKWLDNNAKAYTNRGNSYAFLESYEQSRSDFDKAIDLDSQYAPAYIGRAVVSANQGQYDQAIKDLETAIMLEPSMVPAHYNLGHVYAMTDQLQLAVEQYSKAIDLDPTNIYALVSRGAAYSRLHEYEKAIDDFNQAIYLDPDYDLSYYNRALAYQKLGKIVEAEADFKKYEELTDQELP